MLVMVTGAFLGMASYAATNVDNLLLLAALSAGGDRRRLVIGAILVSATVVLALSASASLLAGVLPPKGLGYLGVVPLALGLRLAISGPSSHADTRAQSGVLPMAALLIANSTDTLAALAPLFAESSPQSRFGLAIGFFAAAAAGALVVLTLSVRAAAAFSAFAGSRTYSAIAPNVACRNP